MIIINVINFDIYLFEVFTNFIHFKKKDLVLNYCFIKIFIAIIVLNYSDYGYFIFGMIIINSAFEFIIINFISYLIIIAVNY